MLIMTVIVLKLVCSSIELPKVQHGKVRFKPGFFQPRIQSSTHCATALLSNRGRREGNNNTHPTNKIPRSQVSLVHDRPLHSLCILWPHYQNIVLAYRDVQRSAKDKKVIKCKLYYNIYHVILMCDDSVS